MYENIKAEMARHNIDYKKIAEIAEIKPSTVVARFSGMSDFKLPEIVKLANYFNCSIDYLVGYKPKT